MAKLTNGVKVYTVAVMNPNTGELVPLPSMADFTVPTSDDGVKAYRFKPLEMTFTMTWTLSPDDWERLQWLLGIHWLWTRYRRTLN